MALHEATTTFDFEKFERDKQIMKYLRTNLPNLLLDQQYRWNPLNPTQLTAS